MTASATFSLCPESVEVRNQFTGVATTVETGHSRARAVVERPLRSWTLTWTIARRETVTEIRRQLSFTKGGALTLEWTPPGESAVEVRLARPGIRVSGAGPLTARVQLDFEEVR